MNSTCRSSRASDVDSHGRARARARRALRLLAVAAGLLGTEATAFAAVAPASFLVQSSPSRLEPFAESRLQLNPPTFRWPAQRGASATYRLELARTPDFADARVEIVRDLWFRPLDPLAPGVWHWRCRVEEPAPGPWLGVETFTLTDDLPRWPVPAWSEIVARVPREHPRVYVRAGDFTALRAAASRARELLAPREAAVRAALAEDFALAPYEARAKGENARPGDPPVRKLQIWESKFAAIAAAGPAIDAAWLWRATGDAAWRDAAKRRALQLAGFDPKGFITERHGATDPGNVDFGNALLVHDLGVIYDLLYDEFTPAERARIRAAIVARAAPIFAKVRYASLQLMRAHAWQHGFLDAMVGALAIHGEEPQTTEWLESAVKAFVAFYPWWGGNDGGSNEGTRYFHGPEFLAIYNTLDVFATAFGLRLDEGNPWFRGTPYFLIYSFPPGEIMSRLGDSFAGVYDETDDLPAPAGKARLAALHMARLFRNGHAAAYASALPVEGAGFGVSEILRWSEPPTVAPVPLETLPPARVFRDIGVVFTHSALTRPDDNVRLVFRSSPYGGHGHAHADQNSFHVIAYGEHLLLDSGYYTPTGDAHREEWLVRTKAHNTLLVDGTGQPWGDTTGYGRIGHFESHDDGAYFVGHAATAYRETPLDRFDRHVVWLWGADVQTYLIVDDVAAAGGTPRRFDWLLHAARAMKIDAAARRVDVTGERGAARVTFLAPGELAFEQQEGFDVPATYVRKGRNEPLPDQWHLKATPARASAARFVTVVQVARPGVKLPAPRLSGNQVEVAGRRVTLPEPGGLLRVWP